jgi:hypothetical protein
LKLISSYVEGVVLSSWADALYFIDERISLSNLALSKIKVQKSLHQSSSKCVFVTLTALMIPTKKGLLRQYTEHL